MTNEIIENVENVQEEKQEERKNLANCKPSEFLKQTYRIKKEAEKWMKATDILNIRKKKPQGLKEITKEMTAEEKEAAEAENKKKINEQMRENFSEILDKALDENAEGTLRILALCSFIEPKDADNYSISFYIKNLVELIENDAVIDFFTLLAKLGN